MSFITQAARAFHSAARVSAPKAAKAGSSSASFKKAWLSDSATYPIIAIMAGAGALVAFQMQRLTFSHPDIIFNKEDRSSFIRDNDQSAEEHHEHFLRKISRTGNTEIMPGLNKAMIAGKVRE